MKKNFIIGISAAFAIGLLVLLLTRGSSDALPTIGLTHHSEGGYTLTLDGKPFWIKGVCYLPTPVGENVHYNFWGQERIWKTDGKLLEEMGANTVRFYRLGKNPTEVKNVIKNFHKKYGLYSLVGHDLGFWDWPPPNYAIEEFRQKVEDDVLKMVREYKNTPGVLMWILGNENNYSFEVMGVQSWTTRELEQIKDPQERSREKAEIYYAFVNELAKKIKAIDPAHPVAIGVGEVHSLEVAAQMAPEIDIVALNVYRGPGFGNLFNQVKQTFSKPVLLMEWGADSYDALAQKEDQAKQAEFLKLQWRDIYRGTTQYNKKGVCLGGTVFEWTDEWWKGNEHVPSTWSVHDTSGQFSNAAYYYDYDAPGRLNMNEEWWGLVSVAKTGKDGSIRRAPKQSYYALKEAWRK